MNRKEWREVGKQSLFFVLAMAGMFLLVGLVGLLDGKPLEGEKLIIIFGVWLLMFSMFLGLSPFAMDSKQRGLEYLLVLPYSRRRLLLIKFLPRLAAVVFFYIVFAILYGLLGDNAFAGGFTIFSLVYFSLFLISFSLSLAHENFIVQSLWAGIALCGYVAICLFICARGFAWKFGLPISWTAPGLWRDLAYDLPGLFTAIAVFLLMALPFVISVFLAFEKFDLKPARAFNRRQFKSFVPLLLLAFALSLGITWLAQHHSPAWAPDYFILGQQRLLRTDFPGRLTLFSAAGRLRVKTERPIDWGRPLLEQGERLYMSGLDFEDGSWIIGCLNWADRSWKIVHRISKPSVVANGHLGIRYDGANFVYLLSQPNLASSPRDHVEPAAAPLAMRLVRVDPASGRSRALGFQAPAAGRNNEPWLVGSDERDGRRFWLVALRGHNVIRLWADGRCDELGLAEGIPVYAGGHLLAVRSGSLAVTSLLESGNETVREIPGRFRLGNPYFFSQRGGQMSEVYAEREKRIVHIDLATLSISDVGPARGLLCMVPPGDFYFVEFASWPPGGTHDTWKKLYRLRGGTMTLLKKYAFENKGYGHLRVGRQGVLLTQHRIEKGKSVMTWKAFAFPDLKELPTTGLD